MMCMYDAGCYNSRCTRFHPAKGQSIEHYASINGIVFFSTSSPSTSVSPIAPKYLKPCRHSVCLMKECTFAHSVEQLHPIPCAYNDRCANGRCTRFHPGKGQSKEDYAEKNGFVFSPSPLTSSLSTPFIIHFEIEDDIEIIEELVDDEDILECLRREDGEGEDGNDENKENKKEKKSSLQDLIDLVPEGVYVPQQVHLLPYDRAYSFMLEYVKNI